MRVLLALAAAVTAALLCVVLWRREGLATDGGEVAAPSGGGDGQLDPAYDWTETEAEPPTVSVEGGYKTYAFADGQSFRIKDPQIGKRLDGAFDIKQILRDDLAKYGEDGMAPEGQAWWEKHGPAINWDTTQFDIPGSGRTLAGMWAENERVYAASAGRQPDWGPGDAGRGMAKPGKGRRGKRR